MVNLISATPKTEKKGILRSERKRGNHPQCKWEGCPLERMNPVRETLGEKCGGVLGKVTSDGGNKNQRDKIMRENGNEG